MLCREHARGSLILLLTILLGGIAAEAQDISTLEIKTSVIERKTGRGDFELKALHLTIGLVFTNVGPETIVLYAPAIDINHVWISKTVDDFKARRFEQSSSINDIWTAPKAVDLGVKDFLVLKPGKSVTLKRPLTLLTPIDTARTIKGSVQKGSHVFALSLHDWPYDESETALLSKVVSKLGRLWLKGLISIPSPIEI